MKNHLIFALTMNLLLKNKNHNTNSSKMHKSNVSKNKQYDSQQKINFLCQALRNTKWGRISPEIPWK